MNKYIGSIEIICGPMFSGKTEELIKRAKKEITSKKNISVFKPSIDNRYSQNNIVSHNKNKIKCNIIDSAKEMLNFSLNTNIFFIDEAQFFDEGIIKVCKQLTNQGKKIIIAGLDRDYEAKPFGQMENMQRHLKDNELVFAELLQQWLARGRVATVDKRAGMAELEYTGDPLPVPPAPNTTLQVLRNGRRVGEVRTTAARGGGGGTSSRAGDRR